MIQALANGRCLKRKITHQGVAGPVSEVPLEGVVSNTVRARGRHSPSNQKKIQVTIDKPFILIYIVVYKCIV